MRILQLFITNLIPFFYLFIFLLFSIKIIDVNVSYIFQYNPSDISAHAQFFSHLNLDSRALPGHTDVNRRRNNFGMGSIVSLI